MTKSSSLNYCSFTFFPILAKFGDYFLLERDMKDSLPSYLFFQALAFLCLALISAGLGWASAGVDGEQL